jgi:hypothetical protein
MAEGIVLAARELFSLLILVVFLAWLAREIIRVSRR